MKLAILIAKAAPAQKDSTSQGAPLYGDRFAPNVRDADELIAASVHEADVDEKVRIADRLFDKECK